MRVEVQGLLSQTVAVLVTDGSRYELFRADDRSYQQRPRASRACSGSRPTSTSRPEEAIDLLLGMPAPDPRPRSLRQR